MPESKLRIPKELAHEFGSDLARALWVEYGPNDKERWKRYRAELKCKAERRKEKSRAETAAWVEHRGDIKHETLTRYSPNGIIKCIRCGFADVRSLSLHPGGGGWNLYDGLKKAGWPEGYQVLCMNCQFIGSGRGVYCSLKVEVLGHYSERDGIRCVNCNFSDLRALSLDHVEGGGRKHLEKLGIGKASEFYRWLRKQNYPKKPLLQVLCMNCQFIKASENLEW